MLLTMTIINLGKKLAKQGIIPTTSYSKVLQVTILVIGSSPSFIQVKPRNDEEHVN